MSATVKAFCFTGAGPTGTTTDNADSASFRFCREDTQSNTGNTPIPIPTTATSTNYSWIKYLGLDVTATAATTISARTVALSAGLMSGLGMYFKAVASASYAQASSGNKPADITSGGASTVPTGYTAVSTSTQTYDSSSVSAGSTGLNGSYCVLVLGVDNTYAGGGGTPTGLAAGNGASSVLLGYNEQ